jgi:hypothetical protein
MGKITYPPSAMLFAGLIYRNLEIEESAKLKLGDKFGEIYRQGITIPFTFTDYYDKEMSGDLKREFISFKKLIEIDALPEIKLATNKIESELAISSNNNRRINIDPGYITPEKMVLATTKNWGHRPYLTKGIYAELTYRFQKGSFTSLEWTYPDYRTKEVITIFNEWRKWYLEELKNKTP